ncbi:MAG TPA: phage minor head protein [Iamia sp.]|nr:phage minor head protein [Iamia sp.]
MDWRAAHRARVEALEAEATDVMLSALGPIMAGVASRFAVAAVTAAGGEEAQARASLDDLSAIDVQWRAAVHDQVLPWFAQVYEAGGQAAVEQVLGLGIAVLDVDDALMNHAAATYLQGVENRFYPLGEEAWGKARAELVEGFAEGEGVGALRARIREVTDLTARQAETLARTEVIAASNMGAQARIDLMGDGAPGYRQWLSTMDTRTRPTHRAADGQVQPRGTAFDVGGSALMVPGDPDGPAREVINCRCTVLFTDTADPLLMAGRQQGGIVDEVEEALAAAAVSGPAQVDSTTGDPHTGAMVALIPADPEAWAVAQGEPPEAIHLTLAYLGDGADIPDATFDALLAQAEQLAAGQPPVEANVFGAAVWNMSGPEGCLVLSVGGADLEPLHAATWVTVQRAGVANGEAGLWMPPEQHSPWVAHVCLSYQPDPAGTVQQVAQQFEGPITFDRLRVTRGAEAYDFTLAGAPPEEDIDMDRADLAAMIDAAFARHGLTAAVEPGAPASGDPTSADAGTDDGPPAQPGEHLRAIMHRQGVATGLNDSGRVFTNMTYREPPFAYHSQVNSSAHGGTPRVVPVGLVTRIVETPSADYGFIRLDLDNPDAMEHARRAVAGFDRWVSIGGDETAPTVTLVWPAIGEPSLEEIDPSAPFEEVVQQPEKVILDGVNVAELTSVSTPAQADAVLEPTAELMAMFADAAPAAAELPAGEVVLATGGLLDPAVAAHVRIGEGRGPLVMTGPAEALDRIRLVDAAGCGCGGSCGGCGDPGHDVTPEALVAAAYTVTLTDLPPASWFQEPTDVEITSALSITDDGRLYGLVAPFGTNHRAYAKAGRTQFAPEGNVDYARFMGKWAVTAEGRVPAGPVTMGCGHATMTRHDHDAAPEHYDNSCSVFGMVAVGESKRLQGVWMAGAVLPGTTPAQIARALACTCSGDWQSHPDRAGWQELVAALLVPVPGFAMPHASTSYRGDALVASAVPVVHVATAEVEAARLRALTISRLAASVGRTPAARVLSAARRGRA